MLKMDNTFLITGATGGIGKELCKQFASYGYNIILIDRDESELIEVSKQLEKDYKVYTYSIACDLLDSKACKDIYQELQKQEIEVSILCNNAGFGIYGDFLDTDFTKHEELIMVNLHALMELSYLFGKDMRNRKNGCIINLSSISGFLPGPYMASYYASKAFILSFTASLAKELKPYNIQVKALCPGVIKTMFYVKAKADLKYSWLLHYMPPESAKHFAKKAYKQMMNTNKLVVLIGMKNKIIVFLRKLVSIRMASNIIAWIQRKK